MDHHVYFWLKEERKNPSDRAAFESALDELCEIPLLESGRWRSPGHEPAGVAPVTTLLDRFNVRTIGGFDVRVGL